MYAKNVLKILEIKAHTWKLNMLVDWVLFLIGIDPCLEKSPGSVRIEKAELRFAAKGYQDALSLLERAHKVSKNHRRLSAPAPAAIIPYVQ